MIAAPSTSSRKREAEPARAHECNQDDAERHGWRAWLRHPIQPVVWFGALSKFIFNIGTPATTRSNGLPKPTTAAVSGRKASTVSSNLPHWVRPAQSTVAFAQAPATVADSFFSSSYSPRRLASPPLRRCEDDVCFFRGLSDLV